MRPSSSSVMTGLLVATALVIILAGMRVMADLLVPILLAYTFAIGLLPLVKRLEEKGLPRSMALAGVFLLAFVLSALVIGFFLLELQQFARRLPAYQGMLTSRFEGIALPSGRWGEALNEVLSGGRSMPETLTRTTLQVIARLLSATTSLLVFLFILLVMTLDFPGVSRAFYGHMTRSSGLVRQGRRLIGEIQTHLHVQTISNLLSAGAVMAALLLFRVDFAVLWGLLTFFLSFIPRIGMLASFIPPILMAFVQYGVKHALLLLVICLALNGLMDNFVTPMLTKKGLALRATTVTLASMLWIWVFGPLGALLAVPMTLFTRKLLESDEKTLPVAYAISTDDYNPSAPD